MLKIYLIGLMIFSVIKIGAVIIMKYRVKEFFKIKPFQILLDIIIWPVCCIGLIRRAIKRMLK